MAELSGASAPLVRAEKESTGDDRALKGGERARGESRGMGGGQLRKAAGKEV